MNALFKKSVAEFLGTAVFLTAIAAATSSGSPFKQLSLALALGLMILLLGPISGGHFNPAVSIYFYAKREIGFGNLISYLVAQLAGAFAGIALGLGLWSQEITPINDSNQSSLPLVLGEILATAGLVLIIGLLIKHKQTNLIWISVATWVFAAGIFTGTGAQANPAVTFGLLFAGVGTGTVLSFILAQVAGLFVAVVLLWFLEAKTADKKPKAKKTEVSYAAPAATVAAPAASAAVAKPTLVVAGKPVAKKPVAKNPVAKKSATKTVAAAKKPVAKKPAAKK